MSEARSTDPSAAAHIAGECRQCGACCKFAYWVQVQRPNQFNYYLEYAKRFFDPDELDVRMVTDTLGMILVKSIVCRHFNIRTNRCKAHGTSLKPPECSRYPFHWLPWLFEKTRFESCGYTVDKK